METHDMVRMANQIAAFFAPYPNDEAVREVSTHLRSFWEPRMRRKLLDHVAAGGEDLSPIVIEAAHRLAAGEKETA